MTNLVHRHAYAKQRWGGLQVICYRLIAAARKDRQEVGYRGEGDEGESDGVARVNASRASRHGSAARAPGTSHEGVRAQPSVMRLFGGGR